MKNIKFLVVLYFILSVNLSMGQTTFTVTNTLDSGPGSLRDLVLNASSGDAIRFDTSLLNNGSDSIVLASDIHFYTSLTFHGLYTPTDTLFISGGGTNRIFWTSYISKIRIDSMVFVNGNSGNGGAVHLYETDTVIIENSVFRNNTAYYSGGAVRIMSSSPVTANFRNTQIISNTVTGINHLGAGVFCWASDWDADSYVVFENCKINNNRATDNGSEGGAIYCRGGAKSTVIIDSCEVKNNYANRAGGIYSSATDSSIVTVSNTTISGNIASLHSGGGICSRSFSADTAIAVVEVYYSTISNNTSADNGGGIFCEGVNTAGQGATTSNSSFVKVFQSTIVNNQADEGAGIYSTSASSLGLSTVEVINSTITGNTGSTYGGGIYTKCHYNGIASNSTIATKGSIIAVNGPKSIHNSNALTLSSAGYNVFSEAQIGWAYSDIQNATSSSLNLSLLQNNGGITETMVPRANSVALNTGYEFDYTQTQNGYINQIRDIGSAEACLLLGDETVTACNSYTWVDGETYTTSNDTDTYRFINPNGCDSIVKLDLTINTVNTDVLLDGITVKAVNKFGTSYQWLDCDNNFSTLVGDTLDSLNATYNGNFAVEIEQNNCIDTSNCVSVTKVAIFETDFSGSVSIYPNPTKGLVFVNLNHSYGEITYILRDVQGRIILTQTISNIQKYSFVIPNPPGFYVLEIFDGKNLFSSFRIIKE